MLFNSSRAVTSHEDLFVGRYPMLVRAALQLTRGDRAEAEDLVQDAFVRFTVCRPDLSTMHSADAYVLGMLRNMAVADAAGAARPADAASGHRLGFGRTVPAASRSAAWLEARHDLQAACRYGCLRRESSKSGAVFLLRFFHRYVPSEIARLLRTTPAIASANMNWSEPDDVPSDQLNRILWRRERGEVPYPGTKQALFSIGSMRESR